MVLLFLTKSKYPDLSFNSLCSKITPCTLCKCYWSWLCLLAIKTCARLKTNMYHHNEIRSYFTLGQVKFWFTKSHHLISDFWNQISYHNRKKLLWTKMTFVKFYFRSQKLFSFLKQNRFQNHWPEGMVTTNM